MDTESLTLDTQGPLSERAQPHLFLVIERRRPLAGGARYSLANIQRILVGRSAARSVRRFAREGVATLAIGVPDPRMSESHASLQNSSGHWRLTDEGSTNGTFVNRGRVTNAVVSDGDLIEIGGTFFRFRAALPTPAITLGDVDSSSLSGLVAACRTLQPAFSRDLERLASIARSNVPVLLFGESGTGKEVLARALHRESQRTGDFVAVNCGALPEALVESLLFGHKRGAFSGATSDEPGLLRAADGGTLLLDEIGEMPLASQVALLRALQEREVTPVGTTRAVPVDLRVISATHRPLDQLVGGGAFRADLLARLSGFAFTVPPLRERTDDLGAVIGSILARDGGGAASSQFDSVAISSLLDHIWPNNIRELVQCLDVAHALSSRGRIVIVPVNGGRLRAGDRNRSQSTRLTDQLSHGDARRKSELVQYMTEYSGNVTRAALAMGKARTQVQRWLRRFGIDPRAYRK
jgi:transcriptional regulator with AAA-type ATPase domain